MSKKRPREDESSGEWWEKALAWVQSEGGEIHPSLALSTNREPYAKQKIEKGEKLLAIPNSCLVSWSKVEKDEEFGKKIIDAMSSIDASKFYSQQQDIAIAIFLARTTTNDSTTNRFQPYLDTLPEISTFDALPRRWKEEQLSFLKGSSIFTRIQQQKQGIQTDYNLVKDAWKQAGENEGSFPCFGSYSDRLAAVSSRAFAGFGDSSRGGDDMDVALVPLLDLCDHCRGDKNASKNISYQKLHNNNSVVVTAYQTIDAGEKLRITYGAQANAQLLLNYGFCIPDNVEPDGSSNDFVEFTPHPDENSNSLSIKLRTGPKAHSFYGFLNALDAFRAEHKMIEDNDGDSKDAEAREKDASFEENEQDFAHWDVDLGMNMDAIEDEDDEDDVQKEQTTKSYLDALSAFRTRLMKVLEGYYLHGDELEKSFWDKSAPKEKYFAALLVKSEHRTIYFTLIVIDKIEAILLGKTTSSPAASQLPIKLAKNDIELLKRQSEDLATAFVKLRIVFAEF